MKNIKIIFALLLLMCCSFSPVLAKQKKEDDTIDLNIFNLDKPKSFRLPKRYVNFTDEELSLIISVLKDIRPMYIKSGPDEVAALLMDELSRIAALLEVFELWISEKHLG